jgi:hypothetical protein
MQKMGTQTRKVITGESFDTEWKTGHVHVQENHLQVDTQERISKSFLYEGLVLNIQDRLT